MAFGSTQVPASPVPRSRRHRFAAASADKARPDSPAASSHACKPLGANALSQLSAHAGFNTAESAGTHSTPHLSLPILEQPAAHNHSPYCKRPGAELGACSPRPALPTLGKAASPAS